MWVNQRDTCKAIFCLKVMMLSRGGCILQKTSLGPTLSKAFSDNCPTFAFYTPQILERGLSSITCSNEQEKRAVIISKFGNEHSGLHVLGVILPFNYLPWEMERGERVSFFLI